MNLGNVDESIRCLKQGKAIVVGKPHHQMSDTQISKELVTAEKIFENMRNYDQLLDQNQFEEALKLLDKCCVLVDPSLSDKMSVFLASSQSRINDADLKNISIKWRLMRGECFLGSRHLDEANLIATKVCFNVLYVL